MASFISFPLDSDDPKKKKGKEWQLQYAKAALLSYSVLPEGSIGLKSRDIYNKHKDYSLAQQPVSKYKAIFNYGEDWQKSLKVTDWSIQPDVPKYLQIVMGILGKVDFKVQVNPIDDFAKDEIEEEILKQEAKIVMRDLLISQGAEDMANLPPLQKGIDEAEDLDDLNLKELGMRHRTAREMEQVVELFLSSNNFEDNILHQLNNDLIVGGYCVVKDELINKATVKITREDPRGLIMSYCINPDFSDWKHIGMLRPVPVSQLVVMTQNQVTKDQLAEIYKLGRDGDNDWGIQVTDWGNNFENWYQSGTVNVLDLEIRSTDRIVMEERTLENGNSIYKKINPDKKGQNKNNKYEETTIENVYCCKWVVGTDILFDYGVKKNMKRDKSNASLVMPSYHVQCVDFFDMRARSRMEGIIPYADAIQTYSLKLQHTLNSVIPNGYVINIDALEAVDLGAGGDKMSPKNILELLYSRGILLSRTQGIGTDSRHIPRAIEKLDGGVGSEVVELINLIRENKQMMKEALGLNDFTDGGTPNPRALNQITKAAEMGTSNALSDIFRIHKRLVKTLTKSIIVRAQDIVKYGDTKYLLAALGSGTVKRLKHIGDIYKYLYSVTIQDNPTPDEVLSLQEQIKIGQQAGDVTIYDVLMLDNLDNIKQKQEYLAYRVKKNREQKQKEALQLQQMNGQIQVQSAQAAEQAKQQTIQMQIQMQMEADLQIIAAEKDKSITVEQIRLEGKRIDATGRVESAEAQAEGRDIANKRDNIVKLELAETPKDTTIVENIKADNPKSTIEPQTAFGNQIKLQEFNFLPEENEMEVSEQEIEQPM